MQAIKLSLIFLVALAIQGCVSTAVQTERASEIRPGGTYYGQLSAGAKVFTFTLSRPTHVVLETTTDPGRTMSAGFNGRLLDADGNLVAEDRDSGEARNFRIDTRLDAGTWYLEIRQPYHCGSICQDYNMSYALRFRTLRDGA